LYAGALSTAPSPRISGPQVTGRRCTPDTSSGRLSPNVVESSRIPLCSRGTGRSLDALWAADSKACKGNRRYSSPERPSTCHRGEPRRDSAYDQYDLFMGTAQQGNQFRPDWRTEYAIQTGRQPLEPIPALFLLFSRGLLLWLVIPCGFAVWLFGSPWFVFKNISLGQFLGWLDLNLCVALQRGPLRPFIAKPRVNWISGSKMHQTEHRVRISDFW
jgi:hypothetical protein